MIDKSNWLHFFKEEFFQKLNEKKIKKSFLEFELGKRGEGFYKIFETLIQQNQSYYTIVETGTLRSKGSWGDGQSSILFESFLKAFGGCLYSVDISSAACSVAEENLDENIAKVTCSDSVEFLKNYENKEDVNLFYLDSWDVDWKKDEESAAHHLKEFLEIEKYIRPGTLLVIDDNNFIIKNNKRTGKGRKIVEYLSSKNIFPIYDNYQIIYQF